MSGRDHLEPSGLRGDHAVVTISPQAAFGQSPSSVADGITLLSEHDLAIPNT